MKTRFDRYYHQFFVLPSIGVTYGRPNGGCMFAICLNWLCWGVAIGFKKKEAGALLRLEVVKMANEKRLIDANALSDKVDESKHNNPHSQGMVRVNHRNEHDHFCRMIYDAPTVDAVEVVRCKDCKHYREGFCFCENWWKDDGFTEVGETDFCSYGERKDDDTTTDKA